MHATKLWTECDSHCGDGEGAGNALQDDFTFDREQTQLRATVDGTQGMKP